MEDEIPGLKRKRGGADVSRLDRLPPNSQETEQGVLGCVLIDPSLLEMVRERAPQTVECFYDIRHQTIMEALLALQADRKGIDLLTLGHRLRDTGQLDAVGGLAYLSQLMDAVPSAANLAYYLDDLVDLYQRRRVLALGTELAGEAFSGKTGAELVALTTQKAAAVVDITTGPARVPIAETLREIITEMEDFTQGRKVMRGIASGLNFLDNMTCGWKPEEYIVIAARPGGGKTSLAMQLVEHACVTQRLPVGVFSLEMSQKVLMQRLLFALAGVNFQKYRNGFLRDADMALITKAMEKLNKVPLHIDDTAGICCEDLEIRARKMVREHGVRLIMIDYLQLMGGRRGAQYGGDNLVMQVSDASSTILRLKKELKIPFVVLAQENTNREKSDRQRKPMLSDLKDSQKPAQDADVVMFLYDVDLSRARRDLQSKDETKAEIARAEFLWRTSRSVMSLPADIRENEEENLKRVNLYVAKQRNGPTGDCALVMVKPWMRFIDAYAEGDATVSQRQVASGGGGESQEEFGDSMP